VVHIRYFILGVTFLFVLAGRTMARIWSAHWSARIVFPLTVVLFLFGSGVRIYNLVTIGRGQYKEALLEMAERTEGADIHVGSSNDGCAWSPLMFYARYLPEGKRVQFYGYSEWPPAGPDWVVVPDSDAYRRNPEPAFADRRGNAYAFVKGYPCYTLTGQNWYLYRNKAVASER
jgi:hypothetical protein